MQCGDQLRILEQLDRRVALLGAQSQRLGADLAHRRGRQGSSTTLQTAVVGKEGDGGGIGGLGGAGERGGGGGLLRAAGGEMAHRTLEAAAELEVRYMAAIKEAEREVTRVRYAVAI